MRTAPLGVEAERFRRRLLAATDGEHFAYIDKDTCVATCPVCNGALTVRFAGAAARADLLCHRGCDEAAVIAAIRKAIRR